MLKKLSSKKEYLLIGIVIVLFALVSYFSLTSIQMLRGNARVVNYAGIVRGATQRLIKKELMGYPDDALVNRLDSIVNELITGEGPNELIVLHDDAYLNNMNEVRQSWEAIKREIQLVRKGGDSAALFEMSEEYFTLVDHTVSSAEAFSEKQVSQSTNILIGVDIFFVALILVGAFTYLRSAALKRRATELGKIAYVDPLTQMPNRASCERELDRYAAEPPEQSVAVFMFDMNNLKRANDLLGHQGGDRIIADFARVIRTEAAGSGFVGRYGGDEFIALFPNATEETVQQYLLHINEKIVSYNLLHVNEVEKISFAVGYIIESCKKQPVLELVNEADRRMYVRKREMKESKEA